MKLGALHPRELAELLFALRLLLEAT